MVPPGNTYKAEILRYLHDHHPGGLHDDHLGVSWRVFKDLGQRAGKDVASVSSLLTQLERSGCIRSEWGPLQRGGKGYGRDVRTGLILLEEAPTGTTTYHERDHKLPGRPGDWTLDPAAVAAQLLRLAVEAASVPVSDIRAMQEHITCLTDDVATWEQMAREREDEVLRLTAEITTLTEGVNAANDDLEATKRRLRTALTEVDRLNVEVRNRDRGIEGLKVEISKAQQHLLKGREWRERAEKAERQLLILAAELERKTSTFLGDYIDNATTEQLRRLVEGGRS